MGVAPRLPCVCLQVDDTGGGIAPGDLHRLFDPFFTTKFVNQGTGLGLHTARLFAERNHGAISVESSAGAGATFRLWLPQADFNEADEMLTAAQQRPRRLLLAGGTTTALKTLADFWRKNHFEVVLAHGDAQAILLSGEHAFDALLLVGGEDDAPFTALAALARRQKLPLKIIVLDARDQAVAEGAPPSGLAALVLPSDLPPEEILRRVTALLS